MFKKQYRSSEVIGKLKIFYWSNLENLRTDTSLVFINVISVGNYIKGLKGSENTNWNNLAPFNINRNALTQR